MLILANVSARVLIPADLCGMSQLEIAEARARKYIFERAWRLRCSELHVLAQRADSRCHAAKKKLVLADTTLFAERKEPQHAIQEGEATKNLLRVVTIRKLQRTMPYKLYSAAF